ncbi:DUF6308 family protein [Corynebacterium nuruki]|uniref:DUF6308 family protein n=1 Tax=Corynebacterium nuruki TaxID=1032851 RepID=UPI0002485BE9|nr:DUF6308 family protein [Corynebacterium nuruki]
MDNSVWETVGWTRPTVLDEHRALVAVDHLVTYFADRAGHTGPRFTGSLFTELGGGGDRPETAHSFTAEDLVAISTLSVDIAAEHALQLLGVVGIPEGEAATAISRGSTGVRSSRDVPIDPVEVSRLLAQLPTDVDLVDATDEDLATADRLWREIRRKGLGPTRVSKLMARKRPRLCPVIDRDVRNHLGHGKNRTDFFASLRTVLRDGDAGLPAQLHKIRQLAVAESWRATWPVQTPVGDGLVANPAAPERIGRLSDLRVFDIVVWMAEQEERRDRSGGGAFLLPEPSAAERVQPHFDVVESDDRSREGGR